jgi:hypothetical protein
MRKVRNILALLAILGLGAGISACADSPTAVGHGNDALTCWWVDGVLHCEGEN